MTIKSTFFHTVCLLILLVCNVAHAQQGLLWRIDTRLGDEPSYLFGTMHSDDPRITTLPQAVEEAFTQADSVLLEMQMTPAELLTAAFSIYLPAGQTLDKLVSEKDYQYLVEHLQPYGIPEALIRLLKPWAIMAILSTPRQQNSDEMLDLMLYQRAMQTGQQVDGLETAEEQLGVFESLSTDEQVLMLKETVQYLPQMADMFEKLHTFYLERDLSAMMKFYREYNADSEHPALMEKFDRLILADRNHRMAERMRPWLRQGNVFVAVGALHLPGDEGLITLLRRYGYQVEAVY